MSSTTSTPATLSNDEIQRLNSLAVEVEIDSITIGDRIRRDFSHVPDLAESIKNEGLIQPVVLTYNRKLIAGESRIRACKTLGYKSIRAVFRGVLDESQLVVLEATENNARQNLTWQERCLSVDKVHRLRSTNAVLSGERWGVRETGALIGQSVGSISIATTIAERLHANDQEIWNAESIQDAFRVLARRKEDEANALIAAATIPSAKPVVKYTGPTAPAVPPVGDIFSPGSTPVSVFTPGVTPPEDDGERPGETAPKGLVVPLSQMLIHGDAVEYLKSVPEGTYDHCITDWPYAIDMDNLNANNVHGGLANLDSVIAEHGVTDNLRIQRAIVPEIYRTLKPGGFFITWMDMMHWNPTYDLCIAAGFGVQRWPLVWMKTSACMNQAANTNFTKNYEIAIVCRKGTANLIKPQSSSVWTGGNDTEAKALGHPFAKPFGLWNWVFDAVCIRGQHILEPFAGRGSMPIPAVRRGLRITACEVNKEHFNSLIVNVSNTYKSLDPNVTFS